MDEPGPTGGREGADDRVEAERAARTASSAFAFVRALRRLRIRRAAGAIDHDEYQDEVGRLQRGMLAGDAGNESGRNDRGGSP